MADNVGVTPGTGITIRTDDVGGIQLQVVKLALGADGAEDCFVDSGQQVMANSIPVTLAVDQTALPITNATVQASISPSGLSIAGGVYTANTIVGGKQTISGAVRVSGGTGMWQSFLVRDTSNVKPAIMVLLFDSDPSGATYSDKGSATIHSSDISKIIRALLIPSSAYNTFGTAAFADVVIQQTVKASGSTNLYALWAVMGGPTLSAGCLTASYSFLQD